LPCLQLFLVKSDRFGKIRKMRWMSEKTRGNWEEVGCSRRRFSEPEA
jgi:hypothetical protein